MTHPADSEISKEIIYFGRRMFHSACYVIVKSFSGEGCDLLVLLPVEYKQFTIMRSSKTAEIRGKGLDIERVQGLCRSDVQDAKIGIIEATVAVYDISEPVLSAISSESETGGESLPKNMGMAFPSKASELLEPRSLAA
jgi:hypothetical protein